MVNTALEFFKPDFSICAVCGGKLTSFETVELHKKLHQCEDEVAKLREENRKLIMEHPDMSVIRALEEVL